jgi:hypothetical protein
MKFQIVTVVTAALFVAAASFAGEHRGAAVTGAAIAGATAVASILAMARVTRGAPKNATKNALAVMVIFFLVRLLLVAVGTVRSGRAGAIAFVVAFFVPYFAFTAVEGLYLHSIRRTGTTA